MDHAEIWITFGGLLLAIVSAIVAGVRYVDSQIGEMKILIMANKELLTDKLSIGEYNRRHEDLEKRIRMMERWQDHRNGEDRYHSSDGDKYG